MNKKSNPNTGIKTKTSLVAGLDGLGDFLANFAKRSVASCGKNKMIKVLNATNEACKHNGGNETCDEIAEYFGLPFAHG